MQDTSLKVCLFLLIFSQTTTSTIRETNYEFKNDEIYRPPQKGNDDETICFKGLNGTLFAKSLSQLPNVKTLVLEECSLLQIEDGALCSSPFEHVKLEHSHFPELTRSMFGTCPTLKLFTYGGRTTDDKDDVPPSFSSDTFSHFPNLSWILITHADKFTDIPKTFFAGSSSVQELQIYSSNIETIEKGAFDDLTSLRYLNLLGNNLERIDDGLFAKTRNLERLVLGHNRLESFPWDDLVHMPNLKSLQIYDNKIKDIDVEKLLKYLPKLERFSFHRNSMSCDAMESVRDAIHASRPDLEMRQDHSCLDR